MAKNRSVSNYLSTSTPPALESFEMTMLGAASNTKRKLLQSLAAYIEEQIKARLASSNRRLIPAEIPPSVPLTHSPKTLMAVKSTIRPSLLPTAAMSLLDRGARDLGSQRILSVGIAPCPSSPQSSGQHSPSDNVLSFSLGTGPSTRSSSSVRLTLARSSPDEPSSTALEWCLTLDKIA